MWGLLAGVATAATLRVGQAAPDLAGTLALAQDGDLVIVPEGTWDGGVQLTRTVHLRGEGGMVDGGGKGRVIEVLAPGVVIEDLVVQHSGDDLTVPEACIWTGPQALGTTIRRVTARDCLFGVWVHQSHDSLIEDSVFTGLPIAHPSQRGNGVELYDVDRVTVRRNHVAGMRDGIFVNATDHSVIADNLVEDLRYGIHYMYSFHNQVTGNHARRCSGGIALMQSRQIVVEDNLSEDNARQAILIRDMQYSRIAHNTALRSGEGFFFFDSLDNEIVANRVAGNQIGARVWAGTSRNVVYGNDFVGNQQQVFYVAAEDQVWGSEQTGGNRWSDYLGWDQDDDGVGDRPYRLTSFVAAVLARAPAAVLLLNSPTLELLALAQRQLPALHEPSVVDPWPLLRDPQAGARPGQAAGPAPRGAP
ncbi:nitrous oxide reductase family maturation protein NosD [Myxococcota bacterium]|nr:nitrous oxide reductase family maturation protein NosD [Myxococcota bacterium]